MPFTSGPYPWSADRHILKIKTMVTGELAVTATLGELRPAAPTRMVLTIKNMGPSRAYVGFGGATQQEVLDNGFPIEFGEALYWGQAVGNLWVGPIQVVCDAGETTTLRYADGV